MFHPNGPTFSELLAQALSSTERGYDLLAPKFDYTPFKTPDSILGEVAAHIGKPKSLGSALDVCCGTGVGMRTLRPLCRDRVVGIDISRKMLDIARDRTAKTNGKALLEFVRCNVLDMSFESEFDVVVCFGAFGHILPKDQAKFIDRITHALKPGGRFIFVTYYMPSIWSKRYWLFRVFNAVMYVRNLLIRPPFIMYYFRFLLPEVRTFLENRGFEVDVRKAFRAGDRLAELRLVIATLISSQASDVAHA